MQVFDSSHELVAENDDDPHNSGSLDSRATIAFLRGYYLLRIRSLHTDESLATLSIDLTEDRQVSGR